MKKIFWVAGLLLLALTSCSNEPSLQKYFVEKSSARDFMTLDIAANFVNSDTLSLSDGEKKALQSLNKLNLLVYKKDSLATNEVYDKEKETVKGLLDKGAYEQLMRMGSNKEGVYIYSLGEEKEIDEFVFFMYQQENGFGVVRVLGDDMNPNDVMYMVQLLEKGNLNLKQLAPLKEVMVE
ncbi:hypothetical protein GCM10007424_12490 [Flavobacterium suaedae]|uniref:DUF4252 domain-containing protein n=1 Tax=Flavobacterium suaedae TaxID=1767027 RepID=A0ABQ1JT45_9FLAO|nr:DUF4252 domain-containing protein [Flavobacterium suaedae]GGB74084.1 hypothetical protein GCM10007424_12490 [Flavobacterium suaedae]